MDVVIELLRRVIVFGGKNMTLEMFLNQYSLAQAFVDLVIKRQKAGQAFHESRGDTWKDWPTDKFVLETANEALDFSVWLWKLCENDPRFSRLAPAVLEICSEFIMTCKCSGYDEVLDHTSEYS